MVSIGGGGGSKSKSKVKDYTPPEFKSLRPDIAQALQQLFTTGGASFGEAPSTEGGGGTTAPLAAPIAPNEQALLNQLMTNAAQSPTQAAGQDLLLQTIQGKYLDPASNPFLSALIQQEQNRLAENFRLTEAPLLQSRFTNAGQSIQPQGSSAFDTAAAIALRGLTQSQADIATQLAAQNYATERAAQQNAVTQAQNISTDEVNRLTTILQQQALPRLIEQKGIDAGLEEFRRRMQMILDALGISAQLAAPALASSQKSSTSPQYQFGIGFSGGDSGSSGGGTP